MGNIFFRVIENGDGHRHKYNGEVLNFNDGCSRRSIEFSPAQFELGKVLDAFRGGVRGLDNGQNFGGGMGTNGTMVDARVMQKNILSIWRAALGDDMKEK